MNRFKKFSKVALFVSTYIVEFGGMALVSIGAGMIYKPAGFITAGAFIITVIEVKS